MSDDIIIHFGVKGMKWGKRKDDSVAKNQRHLLPDSEKSKRRIKLEARYISEGLTKKDAALKAESRLKTEKILAVAGGVTIAAAAAYVGQREYVKRFAGVHINAGEYLQNINALGDKQDLDRRLYVTNDKSDSKKYRGLMYGHIKNLHKADPKTFSGNQVFESILKTTTDIKAPSHNEAKKLYAEWRSDYIKKFDSYAFLANITAPKDYKVFNASIVNNDPQSRDFMDFVKSKGFNALLDSNDQFISGFDARKPLILFNGKSSVVESGRKIIDDTIGKKAHRKEIAKVVVKSIPKAYAPHLSLGLGVSTLVITNNTRRRYASAKKYLEEHPNSDMSLAEAYALVADREKKKV